MKCRKTQSPGALAPNWQLSPETGEAVAVEWVLCEECPHHNLTARDGAGATRFECYGIATNYAFRP